MFGISNPGTTGARKRLLFDDFNTDASGPLATPRTCDPGPGTVTLLSSPTGAQFATSGGKLTMARPSAGHNIDTYRIIADAAIRINSCGLATYATFNAAAYSGTRLTIYNASFGLAAAIRFNSAASLWVYVGSTALTIDVSLTASVDYQVLIVISPPHILHFIRGGSQYPGWTLLFASKGVLYPSSIPSCNMFDSTTQKVDKFGVEMLPWNWQQPHRIMQSFVPLPVSGTAYSAVANGLLVLEWRPKAAEVLIIRFRRIDDDNCYRLECDQTNSTIKLFRRVAAVDTELDAGKTMTWSVNDQYRVKVRLHGGRIQTFVVGILVVIAAKHVVTGETFQLTESGASFSGFLSATNLEVWPRDFNGTDVTNIQPVAPLTDLPDENLCVWTTDWHVTDVGSTRTRTETACSVSHFINSLRPKVVLNLGDNGESPGSAADFVGYRDFGHALINRPMLTLRGNHDEDSTDTVAVPSTFVVFDSVFPNLPYHGTLDWNAPKIRFIAFHATIIHVPDPLSGFFETTAGEVTWLSDQITALPVGWKAIVCSHPSIVAALGNQIHATRQGTELIALLAAAGTTKIAACFCGHRHLNNVSSTQDGILHITGGAIGYTNTTTGNFTVVQFDPANNKLVLHLVARGHFNAPYNNSAGATTSYVPIEISLA